MPIAVLGKVRMDIEVKESLILFLPSLLVLIFIKAIARSGFPGHDPLPECAALRTTAS